MLQNNILSIAQFTPHQLKNQYTVRACIPSSRFAAHPNTPISSSPFLHPTPPPHIPIMSKPSPQSHSKDRYRTGGGNRGRREQRTILCLHGFNPRRNERVRELAFVRYPCRTVKFRVDTSVQVYRIAEEVVWAKDEVPYIHMVEGVSGRKEKHGGDVEKMRRTSTRKPVHNQLVIQERRAEHIWEPK